MLWLLIVLLLHWWCWEPVCFYWLIWYAILVQTIYQLPPQYFNYCFKAPWPKIQMTSHACIDKKWSHLNFPRPYLGSISTLDHFNIVLNLFFSSLSFFLFLFLKRRSGAVFPDFISPGGPSVMTSSVQQVWINQDGERQSYNDACPITLKSYKFGQGILTEGAGSVQLTSSLR